MLLLNKPKPRQLNDDNLIPLINIVFLMLIFFLVAGQIITQDSALFSAPESSQNHSLEDSDVTILVAADKTIWVNNEQVDGDLLLHLKELALPAEARVILKVDANLKAPILDPVLSALQSLGIQRLKLVTVAVRS